MKPFDIALKVKAKNGILQKFIDERGWSQADFARELGFTSQDVGPWFNMQSVPSVERMFKICELVNATPEELFPPELFQNKDWLKKDKEFVVYKQIDIEMLPFHELKQLSAPEKEIDPDIDKALVQLTPREEKVLKMRIGYDGEERTLREIGEMFGLHQERIRQIESKALRKFRRNYLKLKKQDAQ